MPHDAPDPDSPRLSHCPQGLPRAAYLAPEWFTREMDTVFAQQWLVVGRLADLAVGQMRGIMVGQAPVLLVRTLDGALAAYHNSCRHRGAEICPVGERREISKLITCPYHAWAYAAADGRLISTGYAHPTDDFERYSHGLKHIAHRIWQGFVLLNLSAAPGQMTADVPLTTLDHWPMADLVTGHRWQVEIACNWKVFWENYSECLHCPGIHPELCERVPIYKSGIMAASDARDWQRGMPRQGNLAPGAESWTLTGAACGPSFPDLSHDERQVGYTFVTLWPSAYVVAHVDHVRAVRIEPLSPTRMRLVAEWYFSPETLAQPGFRAAEVAAFAQLVMQQDGAAAEMNQRGIASPAFDHGRLMPEEYEIHRFHQWLLAEMAGPKTEAKL